MAVRWLMMAAFGAGWPLWELLLPLETRQTGKRLVVQLAHDAGLL